MIPLRKRKSSPFGLIYQLSKKELKVLKEYINDNLKKRFIKLLKSLARSLILFVFKKDGSLKLCVDYQALNNITITDKYVLSLLINYTIDFKGRRSSQS